MHVKQLFLRQSPDLANWGVPLMATLDERSVSELISASSAHSLAVISRSPWIRHLLNPGKPQHLRARERVFQLRDWRPNRERVLKR